MPSPTIPDESTRRKLVLAVHVLNRLHRASFSVTPAAKVLHIPGIILGIWVKNGWLQPQVVWNVRPDLKRRGKREVSQSKVPGRDAGSDHKKTR
jgi:hypothetical protein